MNTWLNKYAKCDIKLIDCFINACLKLHPLHQIKNPTMFTVYVGSLISTGLLIQTLFIHHINDNLFGLLVTLFLWLTLLLANFAESLAEMNGKAQAASLRRTRHEVAAKKLLSKDRNSEIILVKSGELKINDYVLVEEGDYIPCDGDVIEGIASVNESAITGESAPVIRESGGDKSSVTGGTRLISDWLIIKITVNHGETFLDHMINLVEGSRRQKTPNEIALNIILAAFTIIFLLVCATLLPYSIYTAWYMQSSKIISITVLVALFVCLAPTTISALISAIGIAGMDRMIKYNVVALSGRAIEAAGDVNILLLDKTGTITLGNRQASEFIPVNNISDKFLAHAAQLSSIADETVEGRSVVVLAKEKYGIRGRNLEQLGCKFISFTAQSKMSGIDLKNYEIRKGAPDAIIEYVRTNGGEIDHTLQDLINNIAKQGETPLLVASKSKVLGIIRLKDIIKGGIKERFADLRSMGIKTIMVTGDNEFTSAAIAAEAGVDDFLAQATPKDKLDLIKKLQQGGNLVAMAGDGTNDAPALAQADVAVAMNTGTQIAKEAGNMIDLDSNPTKLVEIVTVGKQLLITRGAITTFSISNDLAKYFAILPAAFANTYPALNNLNIMRLSTPQSAILSAVIFNALIILCLVPLALKGVNCRSMSAVDLLKINMLVYGVGGFVTPFIGIKIIDFCISNIFVL